MEKLAKAVNSQAAGVAVVHGSSILLAKRIEVCPVFQKPITFAGYWSTY